MDALEVILWMVGVLFSVWLTWWVSQYYYQKSKALKRLSFGVLSNSSLVNADRTVRDHLKIQFQGEDVTTLTNLRVIVGNSGNQPLSKLISAPSIALPKEARLIKAQIIYVHPEGRQAKLDVKQGKEDAEIIVRFDVLNPDEYVVIEILVDGTVKKKQLLARVEAEGLPPTISAKDFDNSWLIRPKHDWNLKGKLPTLGVMLVIIALGLAVLFNSYTASNQFETLKQWSVGPLTVLMSQISIVSTLLFGTLLILLGIIGGGQELFAGFKLLKPDRCFFDLPDKLRAEQNLIIPHLKNPRLVRDLDLDDEGNIVT